MSSVVVSGNTSGAVTLEAPSVAGTVTVTLPAAAGTMLTSASSLVASLPSVGVTLIGGKITVTMAANAVTLAIKTDAGSDPSASSPVLAWFRSSTLTDGASVLRQITAATSTVISSGSTGGTVANIPHRVYVDVIDNGGTVELAWHQTLSSTLVLKGFSEAALITTTAEGGTGGADSSGTIYSTTARSNVAFRIAAYFESTQATAGTWASNATVVQQMALGVNRTGDCVQRAITQTGAVATGTTAIPDDDTIPQNTEGEQYMSQSITPTNSANLLEIKALLGGCNCTAGAGTMIALFQDSTANALAATQARQPLVVQPQPPPMLNWTMVAATTSSTTFKLRAGNGGGGGTFTFNGSAGGRIFGGVMASFIRIDEVCV